MKAIMFCIGIVMLCTSCIPTVIGAVAYKNVNTRKAREQFMANFNQTNLEREKAGLPPLDLCTEKYNYDKKWADDDPVCEERIIRYESGDTDALGHPELEVVEVQTVQQPVQQAPAPQPTPQQQSQPTYQSQPQVSPGQTPQQQPQTQQSPNQTQAQPAVTDW